MSKKHPSFHYFNHYKRSQKDVLYRIIYGQINCFFKDHPQFELAEAARRGITKRVASVVQAEGFERGLKKGDRTNIGNSPHQGTGNHTEAHPTD